MDSWTTARLCSPTDPDVTLASVRARLARPSLWLWSSHAENQTAAAEYGVVSSLTSMFRSAGEMSDSVRAEAAGALWALSDSHAANKASIASAGAIASLVSLLEIGGVRAKTHAMHALAAIGYGNVENQAQITTLLVGMLGSGGIDAKSGAAASLWRLVQENPESQQEIASAGSAKDLIALLKAGSEGAKAYSLWSLSLSIDASNQAVVLQEGGVRALVARLSSWAAAEREQAAGALHRLATGCPDAQKEIAAEGGISPLIAIIDHSRASDECDGPTTNGGTGTGSGTGASGGPSADALREGSEAAAPSAVSGGEAHGDPAERQVDGTQGGGFGGDAQRRDREGEREGAREYAAATLADLAQLKANVDGIVHAGGIGPLVFLLTDGGDVGRKFAASAIACLSRGRGDVAGDIAEAGAVSPLVNLLSGDRGELAQEEAAGALFEMSDNAANRLEITDAGGIGPLVQLLGTQNTRARERAEGALVRLSIENANRVLIIHKLVSMLFDNPFDEADGAGAQEQAAAALANLARDSADNRVSIVDAGGIEPLLALLSDSSVKAKENSVNAITQLAYKSHDIQQAIAAGGCATADSAHHLPSPPVTRARSTHPCCRAASTSMCCRASL